MAVRVSMLPSTLAATCTEPRLSMNPTSLNSCLICRLAPVDRNRKGVQGTKEKLLTSLPCTPLTAPLLPLMVLYPPIITT